MFTWREEVLSYPIAFKILVARTITPHTYLNGAPVGRGLG
jgi:hypothetical protein